MSIEDIADTIKCAPIESSVDEIDVVDDLPERAKKIVYPLDALGPILGEAAKCLVYHVQVPEGIAAQSVLSAAALVAQAHIDVERGNIGIGPVSIFCLSIAESGDRKSAVDRLALKPIRLHEKKRQQSIKEKERRYKAKFESWTMRRAELLKAYRDQEIDDVRQAELSDELLELEQKKPTPPLRTNITFSEPTSEGIWRHYCEGEPSAGLFSDEGISFFYGHGMNDESKGRSISLIAKLWDGDPLTRTRAAEGQSGVLAQRRLSCHLMIQPVVASKVLSDTLLQGQGFLARFLICYEKSIAGTRLLAGRNLDRGIQDEPAIKNYWERMTVLLERPINIDVETGALKLITSRLTDNALDRWSVLHDEIEDQLKADGQFVDVKAFASKAAEHAARIAAVLAFIEDYDHPSVDHIERAAKLISYYLESMKNQTLEAQEDVDVLLSSDLLSWIKEHDGQLSAGDFKSLPSPLRAAKVARRLLTTLVADGHLRVSKNNTRTKKPSAWETLK